MSMGQEVETQSYENAQEAWALYDTIQIRSDIEKEKLGYPTYLALGAAQQWAFFDQRKADIGIAYTNRDSNEGLEFGFKVYSIGVTCIAPIALEEPLGTGDLGPHNSVVHALFANMTPEHIGVRLKVGQDDKLIHTTRLAPEGVGNFGAPLVYPATGTAGFVGCSPINANGQPVLANRWQFPAPIDIPRATTFKVQLEPSSYLQALLGVMPGPGVYTFFPAAGQEVTKPACALIRVSLFGARFVQQRNALHYGV